MRVRTVNYITEINQFRKFAYDNYVSSNAVLLWYGLFGMNNDLRWQEWFKVDNLRLMGCSFIRREATLIAARKELIDLGLIEFKKGYKGHPSEYRIIMFAEKQEQAYPNTEAKEDNKAEDTESKDKVEKTETNTQQSTNEVQTTTAADKQPKTVNYAFYYYNKKPKETTNTNNYKYKNQPRARNNRFHNFQQRELNLDELERILLNENRCASLT